MKNTFIALILIGSLFLVSANSYGAVTSVGEINVAGQKEGVVRASSTVSLLVTLEIDRSLAEPGEEIKTIEITMPDAPDAPYFLHATGFLTHSSDFKGILRDGNPIFARVVVSGNVLRVELADSIVDFQNSLYEITFDCKTPNIVMLEAEFRVHLRNLDDALIGAFIQPGQADGKPNNDDFTLQVIPNVPPDPVIGFTAEADKTGENDVTLRWQKSNDPDVNGYRIYRNVRDQDPWRDIRDQDRKQIFTVEQRFLITHRLSPTRTQIFGDTFGDTIEQRSLITFRDVNVPPGTHTYQITAFKTVFLRSEQSPIQTVNVSPDTAAPEPPRRLRVVPGRGSEVKVLWHPSVSRDVTTYRITEGLTTLAEIEAEPLPGYDEFIDRHPPPVGSFTYAVIAIDEVGHASAPARQGVITDGLVSYWSFNKETIAGKTVKDIVGTNDGIMYGNIEIVNGQVGEALKFSGGHVDCGADKSLTNIPTHDPFFLPHRFGGGMTLEMWIKPEKPGWSVLAGIQDFYMLALSDEMRVVPILWEGAFETWAWLFDSNKLELEVGKWHHVAWVFPGVNIYINGKSSHEGHWEVPEYNREAFWMGARKSDGMPYHGLLDELRLYNRELSRTEIQNNFFELGGRLGRVSKRSYDVNSDGVVNILDLVFVASRFGQADPSADVNGDGTVDILDLTLIAQML